MEATRLSSAAALLPWRPVMSLPSPNCRRKHVGLTVNAGRERNGRDSGGRLVDENMIVLRMRIREMKISETSQAEPPSNWMEWEKQYYTHYDEDVCEVIGQLQSYLMSIRPSWALGMAAVVTLSVPVSAGMLFLHLIDMAKAILAGAHV
ncbi:uncharacterized protein LOC121248089 [Juglans microcarpa x Juglans regia]|uniref:uncharacterized protein LOC121248089 n=1 Tax=Juglans microcarpa x Juglans regia TaxID=2249226 RepID=UPI001B7F4EE2|nr:uncharacterized protein LOC121248089 [Juglans microcarpa x Juglans regia]